MPAANPHRFQKLLVCTDGSPGSEGAINASLELGRLTSAQLHLLEVVISPLYSDQLPADLEQITAREQKVYSRLEPYQTHAAAAGINLEVRVRTSATAYDGIIAEAAAAPPSLIIIGRKGSTRLSHLLMGSVTARVIGLSPCSVLVVPRDAVLNLKKILLAHDGSEFGEAAWREVISLAMRGKSEVVAVSVAKDERREIECKMVLQHLEASAGRHGITLYPLFLKGRPFERIIETVTDERIDLVAMGSHGRTGLGRLLMGSVTERVIGAVQCPVLVARWHEPEA